MLKTFWSAMLKQNKMATKVMCLICKTESIRRNLQDGFGTPMFYSFENYMTVLDTGFSSSFFMGLEQDDYNSVLSGIEMNYK